MLHSSSQGSQLWIVILKVNFRLRNATIARFSNKCSVLLFIFLSEINTLCYLSFIRLSNVDWIFILKQTISQEWPVSGLCNYCQFEVISICEKENLFLLCKVRNLKSFFEQVYLHSVRFYVLKFMTETTTQVSYLNWKMSHNAM